MRHIVFAALLLTACGDGEDVYTWGDASIEFSTSYCNAVAVCGFFGNDENSPEKRQDCIDHQYFHMCGLNGTCGVSAEDGLKDKVQICSADLETVSDCILLGYYGIIPTSCGEVFDADPSNID